MPTIEADGIGADRSGSGPVLDTARLRIRPLTPDDAEPLERLAGEWEVAKYTARIPHPYPPSAAAEWIAANDDDNEIALAIERRSDGAFIGCCGYSPDEPGAVEIGYWIGRPFWRQGYASEAIAALIAYCFDNPALNRVVATVHPENVASVQLQERLGLVLVGERELDMPARGYAITAPLRAITRQQWDARLVTRSEGCWRDEPGHAPLPVLLVAAVALVDADGRVLIQRRPEGKPMAGLWEFPGGKLHDGETPEAALVRELKEELGIDVTESCLAPLTFASHRYETFHLLMALFVCRVWKGNLTPIERQELAWVRPVRLGDYPMPPADKPLVPLLRDML
jgi:8-oxo-dGTP diphosphatase